MGGLAINNFYTPSGNPATGSEGLSALVRGEFMAISAAFDMVPAIRTAGLFTSVFVQQGNFSYTLPAGPGTLALTADVTGGVAAEQARAMAVEGVITAAVNAEGPARTTAIGAAITTEVNARNVAIGVETARATTAEGTNATAIVTERTRATAAEGVNAAAIATLTSSGAVGAEQARAIAAENANAAAVVTERNRAVAAEGTKQATLGFTPVQQGTGVGQAGNIVKLGWAVGGKLKATVDTTDLGSIALETWVSALGYQTAANVTTALTPYSTWAATNTFLIASYLSIGTAAATYVKPGDSVTFASVATNSGAIFGGGGVSVTGSTSTPANGWELTPSGTGAISAAFNVAVNASSNAMLAFQYVAASDGRLKSERAPISDAEGERFVHECPPYRYIKGGSVECGFIAQDVAGAGFGQTLASWPDETVPDEAFGYTGPKGHHLIMPDKTPTAYLAAGLRSALAKIDLLTADINDLRKQLEATL